MVDLHACNLLWTAAYSNCYLNRLISLSLPHNDPLHIVVLLAHLGVDAGAAQLVLDDHDDDAEHAHDQSVVADPLPFFKQGLPPSQSVPDVWFVLAAALCSWKQTGSHLRHRK